MMTDHTDATCYSTEQARWDALVQRSPQADGAFVYGVATTGVYCRPVCPSRLPNRDNVWFFDSFEEAERAGYRPCKRCMPNAPVRQEPQRKAILQACQIIAEAEEPPTLADLAYAVGLSSSHLHRVFKRIIGVTPKQYAMEKRLERVRDNLERSSTVTDAIYEAGFASSSRFYERAADTLGMAPSAYQNGGRGEFIRYGIQQCSLGWVLVAATDKGICTIDLGDTPEAMVEGLRARFPEAKLVDGGAGFDARMAQVLSFLDAPQDGLDLPLDIRGTAFQRRVWLALKDLTPGSTVSYGEVAARIGLPKAARAVAQACASNPIAVAIPCHRVVRSDGSLGGYRWGEKRKRLLLEREEHR